MPRYLATALQTSGILAICAGVYALVVLVGYQPKISIRPLVTQAWFLCGSGALYLFSTGAIQLVVGRSARYVVFDSRRARSILFAAQLAVLAALLFVMFRGPSGRVFLAGLDTLLAVLVSIAGLSALLTFPDPWKKRIQAAATVDDTRPSRLDRALWSWHVVSCLIILVALVYLEIQPIPGG